MRKGLILSIIFLMFVSKAHAFELIMPTEKKKIVNTNYAFFYGKANNGESIAINGEKIYTASNGAFAHSVKLKDGENRILIRSTYGMQMFKFYKNTIKNKEFPTDEFETRKAYVKSDNVPLRCTPVDAGLNRMSHLYKGTNLLINGSQGNFYRVFLSKEKYGWIAKNDVEFAEFTTYPADFVTMDSERYKNAIVQTIEFTNKIPYTIEDNENEIIFRVYNPEQSENSVYNINIPKPEKYVYSVSMDGGKYTFKVKKLPECPQDTTVIIDAGHGGTEKGAIGCLGDEEKNINLKIAQELYKILTESGYNVIMTRECDGNVSLSDRVKIAQENNADVFISIHLNSIPDIEMNIHKNRGTSVYYFNNNSKTLAEIVEKQVTCSLGTKNDGVRTASLAVIRPTTYVGILVETAYMTNPMDSVIYTSENFAQKAARGIAKGLIQFLE